MARTLQKGLEAEGFAVDVVQDSTEAGGQIEAAEYDAVLLDLMLPKEDSRALLKRWRGNGPKPFLLVLTTRSSEERVTGLDLAADDYITQPFAMEELVARLRTQARRGHVGKEPVLRAHDLEIDTTARTVRRSGKMIHLTPREYALLEFLACHRGEVVTRPMIREYLYAEEGDSNSNVVDVYIRYLRNKIDKDFTPPLIQTRWGEGYLLRGGGLTPQPDAAISE
jgi:DNA-binding response OmpR family regulator